MSPETSSARTASSRCHTFCRSRFRNAGVTRNPMRAPVSRAVRWARLRTMFTSCNRLMMKKTHLPSPVMVGLSTEWKLWFEQQHLEQLAQDGDVLEDVLPPPRLQIGCAHGVDRIAPKIG